MLLVNKLTNAPPATLYICVLAALSACDHSTVSPNAELEPGPGGLTTAPTVATTSPTDNAIQVAVDANLEATFDRDIALSSVDATQFRLKSFDTLVPASVTFDGTTAVLDPDSDLSPSTQYQASLNNGIVDLDGIPLEAYQWTFYTAGTGWADASMLSDGTSGAYYPQINFDAQGNATAVWKQFGSSYADIMASRYSASTGSWGSAELIENLDAGSAYDPQLDTDGSGNVIAVWYQHDGTRNNIMTNRYDASTNTWGTAELLETEDTGAANATQISVNASGDAIAVWVQDDGNDDSIMANIYTAGSGWSGAAFIESNANDAGQPSIHLDANGQATAVWRQNDGSNNNIYVNQYSSASGWGASPQQIDSAAQDSDSPDFSVDADGNIIVVWRQHDGTRYNTLARRYDAIGSSWTPAVLIETDDTGFTSGPKVSTDADGNAIAVWQQYDGSVYNITSNRFDANSGTWGSAEVIESGTGTSIIPQISFDTAGNALATWFQYNGSENDVVVNRYTVGSGWGTEETIDVEGLQNANYPEIGIDSDGSAIAIWYQSDGPNSNIYARRFDPAAIAP